jgi:hypothetical protein
LIIYVVHFKFLAEPISNMVTTFASMNADDLELFAVDALTRSSKPMNSEEVLKAVSERIVNEFTSCDTSSPSSLRTHMGPWWRALGASSETAIALVSLKSAAEVFKSVHGNFHAVIYSLHDLISKLGWDRETKDVMSIYTGLFLAYISAVRSALESFASITDPLLATDLLLGLESMIPFDNKGITNVHKRVRQETESELISNRLENVPTEIEGFEEADVVIEDASRGFERFWTLMDISRRYDPDLLTETKAWSRFSQSSNATLNILLDQPEGFDSCGSCLKEPIEYEPKAEAFPIQISSAAFRRRALFNILFTCSYVSQNSSNALISTGAKTLFSTALKSLSTELAGDLNTLFRFENHWVAWKSTSHSKEVCGPIERRSRIERGMPPFGEDLIDLASIPSPFTVDAEEILNEAVITVQAGTDSVKLLDSFHEAISHSELIENKKRDYRQYVADAILCDISDENKLARLSSSDAGFDEAMRDNNDHVLRWQFRRMRYSSDLRSLGETLPPETVQEEEQAEQPMEMSDKHEDTHE